MVDSKRGEMGMVKIVWRRFPRVKRRLTIAPILILPLGIEGLVVYCDALRKGLGCVLMQYGGVIAYASW
jgi:hypothetical protein